MKPAINWTALLLPFVILAAACEDDEQIQSCEVGSTQTCTCADSGGTGSQICLVGGDYSTCTCPGGPGDVSGDTSDVRVDPTADGAGDVEADEGEDASVDTAEDLADTSVDAPVEDLSADGADTGDAIGEDTADAPTEDAADAAVDLAVDLTIDPADDSDLVDDAADAADLGSGEGTGDF